MQKLVNKKPDSIVQMMHFSFDLGDTIFNRKAPKIPFGRDSVYALFGGAFGALNGLQYVGHKLSIISKITPGNEARLMLNLFYHGIIPHLISVHDVHFCYERKAKGSIAKEIGVDFHVDDRVEVLNALHEAGVRGKILFTEAHDERSEIPLTFERVTIARNWIEVLNALPRLP